MTLKEIIETPDLLPVSRCRTHPGIDVGNADGANPMPELSHECEGGDWYDLGYFHEAKVADYAAHAMNLLPELVEALEEILASDSRGELHRDRLDTDACFKKARSVIKKASNINIETKKDQ